MINERIALVMLDGEVPGNADDYHYTRQYYKSVKVFADASLELCEAGKMKKLERFLQVAWKLFKEGNETVKNGILNVYLFTLSIVMDEKAALRKQIEQLMPRDLYNEYRRLHYVSGV